MDHKRTKARMLVKKGISEMVFIIAIFIVGVIILLPLNKTFTESRIKPEGFLASAAQDIKYYIITISQTDGGVKKYLMPTKLDIEVLSNSVSIADGIYCDKSNPCPKIENQGGMECRKLTEGDCSKQKNNCKCWLNIAIDNFGLSPSKVYSNNVCIVKKFDGKISIHASSDPLCSP